MGHPFAMLPADAVGLGMVIVSLAVDAAAQPYDLVTLNTLIVLMFVRVIGEYQSTGLIEGAYLHNILKLFSLFKCDAFFIPIVNEEFDLQQVSFNLDKNWTSITNSFQLFVLFVKKKII